MTEPSESRGGDQSASGYQMIHSIDVRNFRCFRHLEISNVSRLNVVVGDNGAGKTAFLEAVFLPLCASPEVGARLRSQRGLDGAFVGPAARIEAALWGGFFYNADMSLPISLTLSGSGEEHRSLEISRHPSREAVFRSLDDSVQTKETPLNFTWKDSNGEFRTVTPSVSSGGLSFPSTGEDMDNFFLFPANQTIGSAENAGRFSDLSQRGEHKKFVDLFRKEYSWISDINVEVYGGSPVLFATLKDGGRKLPLPNVSSGINRAVSFMLAIASSNSGVVIIDEIENGLHYSHLVGVWRVLLNFMKEYDCQVFVSTHSQECLWALSKAASREMNDISLFQLERGVDESSLRQFTGKDLELALEYHEEVR